MYAKLQEAVQQCQLRGLYVSSNWAAEQLIGCPEHAQNAINEECVTLSLFTESIPMKEMGAVLMGTSLLALGEYQRCANLFIDATTYRLNVTSSLAVFHFAYSQYLAGEKDLTRHKREASKITSDVQDDANVKKFKPALVIDSNRNTYIPHIFQLLFPLYIEKKMDGYLLYIFGVVTAKYISEYGSAEVDLDPLEIYKQAVAACPYNWSVLFYITLYLLPLICLNRSCWMELASYCLEHHTPIPSFNDIQQHISTTIEGDVDAIKLLHAFFITHIFLEKHRGDLAMQVLKGLHSAFPTSLYVYSQVSKQHRCVWCIDGSFWHWVALHTMMCYSL
jgi:hypothetical protein